MTASRLILAATAATLLLAGCNKTADDQPKAAAGGELLPRSVGDDMLPYDTVQSQASLSPPEDAPELTRTHGPASLASASPEDDVAEPVEAAPPVIDAPPPPQP